MKNNKIIIVLLVAVLVLISILIYKGLNTNKKTTDKLSEISRTEEVLDKGKQIYESASDEISRTEEVIDIGKQIYESASDSIKQAVPQMANQEIKEFNALFESYAGSETKGTQVKALKRAVENSNLANSEHQVRFISGEIDASSKYTVKLSYDSEGYVNRIDVTAY